MFDKIKKKITEKNGIWNFIREKIATPTGILTVVAIMLFLVNITTSINRNRQYRMNQEKAFNVYYTPQNSKQKKSTTITVPTSEEELIRKLSKMGERDRMEYYCGEYFSHLEKKEYNEAYELLYDEFKKNYFPTVDDFIAYIEKTYPEKWALSYGDITRQGDIYVLKIEILDILGSRDNQKSQRIVIRENTYHDYVLSFQVI